MRRWQFDVLWGIAALGSVFLLFSKSLGVEIDPTALTGFGAILTYVLTQRGSWTKNGSKNGSNGSSNGNGNGSEKYTIWDRLARIFEDPPPRLPPPPAPDDSKKESGGD